MPSNIVFHYIRKHESPACVKPSLPGTGLSVSLTLLSCSSPLTQVPGSRLVLLTQVELQFPEHISSLPRLRPSAGLVWFGFVFRSTFLPSPCTCPLSLGIQLRPHLLQQASLRPLPQVMPSALCRTPGRPCAQLTSS